MHAQFHHQKSRTQEHVGQQHFLMPHARAWE